MAPGEQGPLDVKVKRPARRNGYLSSPHLDASEERARQRARLIGFGLMVASSVIALILLYAAWVALRAI